MQVAAIVSPSDTKENDSDSSGLRPRAIGGFFASRTQGDVSILGQTLIERLSEKLQCAGVDIPTVIPDGFGFTEAQNVATSARRSYAVWESTIGNFIAQGAERIILAPADIYTDLDFKDFLRFHSERRCAVTQAFAGEKALKIFAIDVDSLRSESGSYRSRFSALLLKKQRYCFEGYVNRLRRPADFAQLISDALNQRCGLQPRGSEMLPGVWMANDAVVDESCAITGPAFVGAGTSIAAGCFIGPDSAIETDCKIDCGTTIRQSWILAGTYVGVGLRVQRSVVNDKKMFHLDRNTEMAIADRRIIGPTKILSFFGIENKRSQQSRPVVNRM